VSYPEPRYLGDTGEISATYRHAAADAELEYPNGVRVRYLATGATTNGLFGLYRWEMTGTRSGPGPHFHRTIEESFYVLSGSIRIYDGRSWVATKAGDFIHVPFGGIHGFRNESGEPASMLIHFAPGAPREAYFEEMARFAREGQPTAEEMAELYARHDQFMVEGG
jgi:mannose-6-phosphate isomerase-like protein (cupin superfamily)